jgi:hypothetical protein
MPDGRIFAPHTGNQIGVPKFFEPLVKLLLKSSYQIGNPVLLRP